MANRMLRVKKGSSGGKSIMKKKTTTVGSRPKRTKTTKKSAPLKSGTPMNII